MIQTGIPIHSTSPLLDLVDSKFKAAEAGEKAFKNGLILTDCPKGYSPSEISSWKMAWSRAREAKCHE